MATATEPQHLVALARANERRQKAAVLKRKLEAMDTSKAVAKIVKVLDDPPPEYAHLTVHHLLVTVRGMGPHRARLVIFGAGLRPDHRLRSLTTRQRRVLAADLQTWDEGRRRREEYNAKRRESRKR